MPTLDRRLLPWSDSDTDDDDGDRLLATATSRRGVVGGGGGDSYDDRAWAAAAPVDDVLVPAGADADGRHAGSSPPWVYTRRALAAAGLVAGGCLCAYLAWRYCGGAVKLPVSS